MHPDTQAGDVAKTLQTKFAGRTCAAAPRSDGYERRRPEQTLLYQVIARDWPSFRERAELAGGLPNFAIDEFEAYLRCGILEHGLAHLACRRCGESVVVGVYVRQAEGELRFCPLPSPTAEDVAEVALDPRATRPRVSAPRP